jgi:hypothetical protein
MFRSLSDNNDSEEDSRKVSGSICRDTMSKQSTRRVSLGGHPVGFVPLSKFCLRFCLPCYSDMGSGWLDRHQGHG